MQLWGSTRQVLLLNWQVRSRPSHNTKLGEFYYYFYTKKINETQGRHASTKAHEVVDHLANFLLGREEIHSWELNRQPLP